MALIRHGCMYDLDITSGSVACAWNSFGLGCYKSVCAYLRLVMCAEKSEYAFLGASEDVDIGMCRVFTVPVQFLLGRKMWEDSGILLMFKECWFINLKAIIESVDSVDIIDDVLGRVCSQPTYSPIRLFREWMLPLYLVVGTVCPFIGLGCLTHQGSNVVKQKNSTHLLLSRRRLSDERYP